MLVVQTAQLALHLCSLLGDPGEPNRGGICTPFGLLDVDGGCGRRLGLDPRCQLGQFGTQRVLVTVAQNRGQL